MDKQTRDIIVKYGHAIISSEIFSRGFSQIHHLNTTVGDHTLGVAAEAVRHCIRRGFLKEAFLKNVVAACLCHDLGIIGRKDKFKNNYQCLRKHPIDSVRIYKELTDEGNEAVIDSIRHHMFPLKPHFPRHKEGWILVLADKKAAYRERLGHPFVSRRERDEILLMARRITAQSDEAMRESSNS